MEGKETRSTVGWHMHSTVEVCTIPNYMDGLIEVMETPNACNPHCCHAGLLMPGPFSSLFRMAYVMEVSNLCFNGADRFGRIYMHYLPQ